MEKLNLLYSDQYVAVCVKPSGLVCEGEGKDALPSVLKENLSKIRAANGDTSPFTVYPVHRLDRETGGIAVFALCPSAAANLSKDIREGRWKKTYRAWLWGVPAEKSGELSDLLYYDRSSGKSFVVDRSRKGVKSASLEYKVIATSSDKKRSLAEIKLNTGRTHQIRVQFASRGLPVCGDRRYGAPKESGNSLLLFSSAIEFFHPHTGQAMSFQFIPEEMTDGSEEGSCPRVDAERF